jgi:hypothetical protein
MRPKVQFQVRNIILRKQQLDITLKGKVIYFWPMGPIYFVNFVYFKHRAWHAGYTNESLFIVSRNYLYIIKLTRFNLSLKIKSRAQQITLKPNVTKVKIY